MSEPPAARSFLTNTKLAELTKNKKQDVVVLREDATVELALRTLAANRILSAPVVATKKDGGGGGTPRISVQSDEITDVLGFVDLRDVLESFIKELDIKSIRNMKMLQRLRVLETKGQEFAAKSLKDLAGNGGSGADGDFLHNTTAESTTLREIIHSEFLYPHINGAGVELDTTPPALRKVTSNRAVHGGERVTKHVHRLALFNKEGRITHIVSQSDIVRFLLEHIDNLGELADETAEQLGWANKPLISVTPEKPAIEAMELMVEKGISAVAVLNHNEKLIGNFSVSELRTIMSEHFGSLALPVGEFLALEHGTEYDGYTIRSDKAEPEEQAQIKESHGAKWAHERQGRARPHTPGTTPRTPGAEVGQALVVLPPTSSFREVLATLVKHRIHRLYIIEASGKALGLVTLTDVLRKVVETNL